MLRRVRSLRLLILLFIPLTGAAQTVISYAGPLTCADQSVAARAVRTPKDAEVFVQCAYEYVREMGFEEAYRAFHEDERWNSGPIYVWVAELTPVPGAARALVQPPEPEREGKPWGFLMDDFGNDLLSETYRIGSSVGAGWIYYTSPNPATGKTEPKASYFRNIDWRGIPAAIGAGIYRRDLPGTCRSEEVNAAMLDADPSEARLQEFVRCAAMELDSKGYFASATLANDPRWRSGSIYLFGLDTYGYSFFSGSPANPIIGSELSSTYIDSFGGRNVLAVAHTFGETFLYYSNRNPATNQSQRKVTFVKRVTSFGVPLLIGAGYYLD